MDAVIRQGRLLDLAEAARTHKWRERLQAGLLEYLSLRYSGGTYLIPSRRVFAPRYLPALSASAVIRPLTSCAVAVVIAVGVAEPADKSTATQFTFTQLADRAAAARAAGRLDEAVGLYQRALLQRSAWQEGWWALGLSRYELKWWAEARAAFRRLSALAPKAGVAWVMLGLCEFELGDHPRALVHLQRGRALGYAEGGQLASVADYHAALLLNRGGQFEATYALLRGRAMRTTGCSSPWG